MQKMKYQDCHESFLSQQTAIYKVISIKMVCWFETYTKRLTYMFFSIPYCNHNRSFQSCMQVLLKPNFGLGFRIPSALKKCINFSKTFTLKMRMVPCLSFYCIHINQLKLNMDE